MRPLVKQSEEIALMRESGYILSAVLKTLTPLCVSGISTFEINRLAAVELSALGGRPAFLGYNGFPGVICISINDEIVHGIPTEKLLHTGDIVGLDFGVSIGGMITDGAITVPVGDISLSASKLLAATSSALDCGIDAARAGNYVNDISVTVEKRLRKDGLGVVLDLSGHGVGYELHEEPLIPNYDTHANGMRLLEGMTIAIEPMATLGSHKVQLDKDGWTIVVSDGSLGAHFEHTVLITRDGPEVLTK